MNTDNNIYLRVKRGVVVESEWTSTMSTATLIRAAKDHLRELGFKGINVVDRGSALASLWGVIKAAQQ